MSYSFGKSIVTDGLVFYVDAGNEDSYPGSGTTWTDLIGSDDGALTNGPTFDSANGGSFVLDGSNDYVDIKSLVIPANITVSVWVNTSSATSSYPQILTSDDSAVSIRNWQFRLESNNKIRVILFHTSGSNNVQAVTSDTITNGVWTMISFTSDGSNLKVYFNGVEKASTSAPYSILGNGSTGDVLVGARKSSNLADFYDGKIATAQIYDRGLSAAEIAHNYNALKNRFI